MVFRLSYEHEFVLHDVPKQWISKFELYYPDLPGYPIIYVHLFHGEKRVYGFPATVSFEMGDSTCDVRLTFISNIDLDSDAGAAEAVKAELEERFGISERIGKEDIRMMCKGDERYERFFHELWNYISRVNGEYVPYGRLYEETFSIVRFVSAFLPKTGRQSEMRMLYNFMSIFGERVEMPENWKFLHFFVIPTYDNIQEGNMSEFPKFQKVYSAMRKIWESEFPKKIKLDGMEIRSMERAWPHTVDKLMTEVLIPMRKRREITQDDVFLLGRLVDAFNRHPGRTTFFIWSIMSIGGIDYNEWDNDMFREFYIKTRKLGPTKTIGVSQKVVACFLQQGFGKREMIPIDTWVESFYKHALGIESQEEFFDSFENMGKMERLIWVAAQSKKTNMVDFFDILWCIRYGDRGNKEMRGANPISCYECRLRTACPSYEKISGEKILIREMSEDDIKNQYTKKDKFIGKVLNNSKMGKSADENDCRFVCLTRDDVPKMILVRRSKTWKLVDEFSGYILNENNKLSDPPEVMTTDEFIENLGVFERHADATEVMD